MNQGFIVDHGDSTFTRHVSHWVAGAPRKSFWTGTQGVFDDKIAIGVFRCVECGYLESYARPEFEAQ
jgi:hypothetical protein